MANVLLSQSRKLNKGGEGILIRARWERDFLKKKIGGEDAY